MGLARFLSICVTDRFLMPPNLWVDCDIELVEVNRDRYVRSGTLLRAYLRHLL